MAAGPGLVQLLEQTRSTFHTDNHGTFSTNANRVWLTCTPAGQDEVDWLETCQSGVTPSSFSLEKTSDNRGDYIIDRVAIEIIDGSVACTVEVQGRRYIEEAKASPQGEQLAITLLTILGTGLQSKRLGYTLDE